MDLEKKLLFNFIFQPITQNKSVVVDEMCNAFTVINIGTTVAVVNGVPLNPGTAGTNNGESIAFGGHRMEILWGRLDISFPSGGVGSLMCIQKIYLPNQF